jgi:tetratricopeptide (TPR) repeat protein
MKSSVYLFAITALVVSLAFSCKTQQAVTNNNNQNQQNDIDPGSDYVPATGQRNDPISEKKAKEEAKFIDGCIYKMLDNDRAALSAFQEVLEMNPENDAAQYELAAIYLKLGQKDRALKYAAEAVRLNPDNKWYKFRYAEALQTNHKDAEAIAIYKDLIAIEPDNLDLRYRLADCQVKAEQYDNAAATYSEIEKLEGNSDTLARCRINMYEAKKDQSGVENTMKGLTVSFPSNEKYYSDLAAFHEQHQQPEKANEIYKSMAVKFPHSATPHLKLAEVYKGNGQDDAAFKEAYAAFNIPEQLDVKIEYLHKWYPIGDSAVALNAVKKKESDSLCSSLRRTHKDDARSYTVSGDYLLKTGRSKDARTQYRKAIDLSKESYAPWKQMLKLNAENKDDAQQEKDCKEALELFPTQPDPYYYLGEIQYRKKKYDDALNNLQTAMDYNLDNPGMDREIRVMQIEIYRAKGNNREADALVEKMMKLEPQNLEWKAKFAESLINQGKDYYRAEQLMLEVVEKEPNNADYLGLTAWIEFKRGDFELADEYMKKALAITPNDAKMNERMGDIQFRLKKTDDAMKYWNKAKANGGSSPELEDKIKNRTLKDDY